MSGFRIQKLQLEFGALGSKFLELRIQSFGFGVLGLGVGVSALGFRI